MARQPKAANNLQVFRGSLPRADVFTQNAGSDCCSPGPAIAYDKLGNRVRFDNALAHSNPTGANDKISLPDTAYDGDRNAIVNFINENGVGATISGLVIPTYAFVTTLAVAIYNEEPGFTFDIVTRNGLVLPTKVVHHVVASGSSCDVTRTEGAAEAFTGLGPLTAGALYELVIGRDGNGQFSLEADEIQLRVASMPASGKIGGNFRVELAVSYDVVKRAEA